MKGLGSRGAWGLDLVSQVNNGKENGNYYSMNGFQDLEGHGDSWKRKGKLL